MGGEGHDGDGFKMYTLEGLGREGGGAGGLVILASYDRGRAVCRGSIVVKNDDKIRY